MPIYDVIIIGAGHNGLVAACYLAKAGLKIWPRINAESRGSETNQITVVATRLTYHLLFFQICVPPRKSAADFLRPKHV